MARILHDFRFVLVLLAATFLFAACPSPISQGLADRSRDTIPPTISVTNPAEYAAYSRIIEIEGKVEDLSAPGQVGRVQSLTYEILNHMGAKDVSLDFAGQFKIEASNDLRENIVVLLRATDWNGNQTEIRLPLTFPGNEIPSFSTVEGNKEATLTWANVPGVVSYTLYIEASGLAPDPTRSTKLEGIVSPYTVKKLKNAQLYSFLLKGTTADGKENFSSVVRSIPLSRFNLFPSVSSYFNAIELTWHAYPGIASYEVLRSTSADGPYASVSGPIPQNSYRDQGVSQGFTYFYQVRPAQYSSIQSWPTEATADPLAGRSDAFVGTYGEATAPFATAYSNGRLYIADYYYGLRIADVSNPSSVVPLGSVAISSAKDVVVSGDYAYVSGQKYINPSWRKGLFIVNVSNPALPVIEGFADVPEVLGLQAEGIAVYGNYAAMGGFQDGFALIDISSKSAPVVRFYNQGKADLGYSYGAAFQYRAGILVLAVFGHYNSVLYTIAGTPASPTLTKRSATLPYASDGKFSGDNLFLASQSYLSAFNTTNLSSPSLTRETAPSASYASVASVALVGNRAYVALRNYGFATIDISDPTSSMSTLSNITAPGDSKHLSFGNGYVYLSGGTNNPISIYGAGDTSSFEVVHTLSDLTAGASLVPWRDQLYIAERYQTGGYYESYPALYSIANPASAYRSSYAISPSYSPYDYAIAGDWAVIAAERSGVTLWNIATPSEPKPLGTYFAVPGGDAWTVAISGPNAYIGTSKSFLVSMDLSIDGTAVVSGSIQTRSGGVEADNEIRDIALKGDFAFIANEKSGLRVVDISEPSFLVNLSGYGNPPSTGSTNAVAIAGNYVLVADTVDGLLIYDAQNPRSWTGGQTPIWQAPVGRKIAYDVVVRGNYAYIARGASGLDVWDISNPRQPFLAGNMDGFSPVKITLYKDCLYALDGASHLYVVDLVP